MEGSHVDRNQNIIRRDTSESDEGFDRSFLDSVCSVKTKIFNDAIHPQLELPNLCVQVINTPQFQRLKNLKQLGMCYYVYPSASNNRFEHCVGTAYLAGQYGKILKDKQPELQITDKDILCLNLAGLMHDIGHGPFSHLWEHFIHSTGNNKYSHEKMSLKLVDDVIKKNNLMAAFNGENLNETDIVFIKELILGHPLPGTVKFAGRPPRKHFLYQIISNDITKIDVDKFDYISRDCKILNISTLFKHERLMSNSLVVGYENNTIFDLAVDDSLERPTRIIYRKKILPTIEDLFKSRFSLHNKVYQHRVIKIIEEMILDGLKEADSHFKVTGTNGRVYSLSNACEDEDAFVKLTDSIFERIQHWGDGGDKATHIFESIVCRNLYPSLGYISGPIENNILDELHNSDPKIRFVTSKINYGSGQRNPLNNVVFYEKTQPTVPISKDFGNSPQEIRTFVVYAVILEKGKRNSADSCNGGMFLTDVTLQAVKGKVNSWAAKNNITLEFE